jgi:predicted alpha/beta-fold hydrolase
MDPYRAPWWLPGGDLQTLFAPLSSLGQRVAYDREVWATPDGDFIEVDWAGPDPEVVPRLLVLFHGLEGNSRSHYALRIVAEALADGGWCCAVPHFRGCSGEPNLKPRAYHAGDSEEIDWILRRFAERHGAVHSVGISLGGNALLKWLGERGTEAGGIVRRAAAVSAPFNLTAFGHNIGRWYRCFYSWYFLHFGGLRRKALRKLERFRPEFTARGITEGRIRGAMMLPRFDDVLTAPLHGFDGKLDYWKRASALEVLPQIRVPTLLLNAENDPFLPKRALAQHGDLPDSLTLDFPRAGGHAGFPGADRWMARRVLGFLSA